MHNGVDWLSKVICFTCLFRSKSSTGASNQCLRGRQLCTSLAHLAAKTFLRLCRRSELKRTVVYSLSRKRYGRVTCPVGKFPSCDCRYLLVNCEFYVKCNLRVCQSVLAIRWFLLTGTSSSGSRRKAATCCLYGL